MKSQNITMNAEFTEKYKDVVDSFGGPQRMAEKFNWSISTVYKWLSGKTMGLTYAIIINQKLPKFSLGQLIGYELKCDQVYLDVICHFGGQLQTAKALDIAQPAVRAWLFGESHISLKTAEKLEEVSKGAFHPSDFKHLIATLAA